MSCVFQATGSRLGMFVMNIANMGTGLIIAFIYGWQLTLLIIGFLPLLIIGGYLQIRIMSGVAGSNKTALEEAGKVGCVPAVDFVKGTDDIGNGDWWSQLKCHRLIVLGVFVVVSSTSSSSSSSSSSFCCCYFVCVCVCEREREREKERERERNVLKFSEPSTLWA